MTTEAISRLKRNDWISEKFVEFVQKIYPKIDAAIEEVDNDKLTLILVTEKTIEIVTSPRQNQATVKVEIESIPLKEIKKITTRFVEYEVDPDDPIELKDRGFKVTITFADRQDLVIDLTNVKNSLRYKIADVNCLIEKLKSSI